MERAKLYISPNCPHCRRARTYLDKKGISYEEINVTDDKKGLDEMVEKTGHRITPVIVFGDKMVVGYDTKELDRLFDQKWI